MPWESLAKRTDVVTMEHFNQQFTDDKAACMVVSHDAFVMLLTETFFKTFTKNDVCDTRKETEGLFALSCESRAEVDDTVRKAVAAGGAHAMGPMDHGFMYGWSFYDLDRHHWEVLWMDPACDQAVGGDDETWKE